jgi:hypothetical protein
MRGNRIAPVRGFAIGNGDKLARLVFVVRRGERRSGVSDKKPKKRYPPKKLSHDVVENLSEAKHENPPPKKKSLTRQFTEEVRRNALPT